jgi:thioredoxin 1
MVQNLSSSDFKKEVINSKTLVLADFYADWCMPCKMMAPVFEKLSGHYKDKIKFVKINVDDNPGLANNFSISGIPALLFLKKGVEFDRITGFRQEQELKEKIDSVLNK